jgi:hypothetical protein
VVEGFHLPDEYDVIAAFVWNAGTALESGGVVTQHRCARNAAFYLETGKLVLARAREACRDRLLVGGSTCTTKLTVPTKIGNARDDFGQAPQHHRRIERTEIEAVRRQADIDTIG